MPKDCKGSKTHFFRHLKPKKKDERSWLFSNRNSGCKVTYSPNPGQGRIRVEYRDSTDLRELCPIHLGGRSSGAADLVSFPSLSKGKGSFSSISSILICESSLGT